MKKMSKKKKIRIILIVGVLLVAASAFYFGRNKLLRKADTPFLPENKIENKAQSQYQDENGQEIKEESNSALSWKVDLVVLAAELQGRTNTQDVAGNLVIKDLADQEIGTLDLKLDENGYVAPDWTDLDGIENPNLGYNLVLKIPGFLPKNLNNVKLNQNSTVATNTLYAGDTNIDGIINIKDFSGLMAYWKTNHIATDFNGDGTTNQIEFSLMMSNWGKTSQ